MSNQISTVMSKSLQIETPEKCPGKKEIPVRYSILLSIRRTLTRTVAIARVYLNVDLNVGLDVVLDVTRAASALTQEADERASKSWNRRLPDDIER